MPEVSKRTLPALVAALMPRLRAFVRRRLDNLSDAEDVVQDALYELTAAVNLSEPIENITAWLLRVAANRIIDRYRARRREVALPATASREGDPPRVFDELLDQWPAPPAEDPEAAYERDFLLQELTAALAELPAEQREVFLAHELEGRTFRELAEASGVSINTLLGRKHAAVLHLRRRLAQLRQTFDI